jgi:NAD(P)-dependent dehydrogenase (short-subunit alcohol dehydrogenase family)
MSFGGKVGIVTGAGSGLAEATAKLLAARGASVIVADLNEDAAKRVAAEIRNAGGQAAAIAGDVAKREDVERLVPFALEKFGRLDVVARGPAAIRA